MHATKNEITRVFMSLPKRQFQILDSDGRDLVPALRISKITFNYSVNEVPKMTIECGLLKADVAIETNDSVIKLDGPKTTLAASLVQLESNIEQIHEAFWEEYQDYRDHEMPGDALDIGAMLSDINVKIEKIRKIVDNGESKS